MAGRWPPANPTKTTKQRAAQVREYHAIGIDSSHVGAMTLKNLSVMVSAPRGSTETPRTEEVV